MKMKTGKTSNNSIKAKHTQIKHTPLRSCIACRDKRDHRELIRLTCSNTGIEISVGKRKEGRGAYLCPTYECWEIGLKKNKLDHALRTNISPDNRQKLVDYGKNLPKKEEIQK
jgi:predicted RNA-binding protein YlxR (DUF448 family)